MSKQPEVQYRIKSFSEFSMSMLSSIYGPTFRTICPQSYTLRELNTACDHPEYKHYFCGPHDVPGAFCPNCMKPLLRLLAIDTRDERLGLTYCPFPIFSLFHCMTCEILNGVFYYQIHATDGRISILDYKEGTVQPEYIPFYPKPYPRHFQGQPIQLVPLSEEQQWYIINNQRLAEEYTSDIYTYDMEKREQFAKKINEFHKQYIRLKIDAHQIGGFPKLTQGWEVMTGQGWDGHMCPLCNQEMTFLAAIDDKNTDPRGFVGTEIGQFLFTWCSRCFVVEAVCLE